MKKLLLSSLMALIPCAMLVSGNNGTTPQLSGTKNAVSSPMQPYTAMNDQEGMSCPTDEEFAAMFQQIQDEIDAMSPEDRAKLEQEMSDGLAQAYEQMTPEQRAEFDEVMGLVAIQEAGQEIISEVAKESYAQGALDTEAKIIKQAEEILPVLQEAILEDEMEAIAQSGAMPYAPALKK